MTTYDADGGYCDAHVRVQSDVDRREDARIEAVVAVLREHMHAGRVWYATAKVLDAIDAADQTTPGGRRRG